MDPACAVPCAVHLHSRCLAAADCTDTLAGGELTRIPYGGNFAAGGGGGGEAAAETRRALATNAGLRRTRTPQLRAQLAAEGARQAFMRARGAVARVCGPCPGSFAWLRLLFLV
jgi:hypothetical protein